MGNNISMYAVRVNGQWYCPKTKSYKNPWGLFDDLHQSSFVMSRTLAFKRVKDKVDMINRQLDRWMKRYGPQPDNLQEQEWRQQLDIWTNAEIVQFDLSEVPQNKASWR